MGVTHCSWHSDFGFARSVDDLSDTSHDSESGGAASDVEPLPVLVGFDGFDGSASRNLMTS